MTQLYPAAPPSSGYIICGNALAWSGDATEFGNDGRPIIPVQDLASRYRFRPLVADRLAVQRGRLRIRHGLLGGQDQARLVRALRLSGFMRVHREADAVAGLLADQESHNVDVRQ